MISGIYKNYIRIRFYGRKFEVKDTFKINGIPYINISNGGELYIGRNFQINSSLKSNPIGRNHRSILFVGKNAVMKIGDNVKISGCAIVAMKEIILEDNVMIGGNTVIYDSDFHAVETFRRLSNISGNINKNRPVKIGKNVFIGAHSIILKGVEIGENSVIGAGSVVFTKVPSNQVWAGNPAKFIYSLK